jgi:hypothetical protein
MKASNSLDIRENALRRFFMRCLTAIRVFALMLFLMCAARLIGQSPSSSGQTSSGQISGHVVDTVGAFIPRASIFVRAYSSADEKITLADHTDSNGNFTLALPPGAYDILVTSIGFQSKLQIVILESGKTTKMRWKLIAHKCDFPGVNCDTFQ